MHENSHGHAAGPFRPGPARRLPYTRNGHGRAAGKR